MEWDFERELKLVGILLVMFCLVVLGVWGLWELFWLFITGQVV